MDAGPVMYLGWAVTPDMLGHLDALAKERDLYAEEPARSKDDSDSDLSDDESEEETDTEYPRPTFYVLRTIQHLVANARSQLQKQFPKAVRGLESFVDHQLIHVAGRRHTIIITVCNNRQLTYPPSGLVEAMKNILLIQDDPQWHVSRISHAERSYVLQT